jgi:PAS domain S-box-containing protein
MPKKPAKRRPSARLRRQAEAKWKADNSGRGPRKFDDFNAAIYELEVRQIELELQNDDLLQTQLQLTEARDAYLDLYEFAPVGYVTLDLHRVIRQANLTAALLLGVDRSRLLGMRIERFAVSKDRDALYLHLQDARHAHDERAERAALDAPLNQTCELMLRRGDGSEFYGRLQTLVLASKSAHGSYRVVLTDVSALYRAQEALKHNERRFRALTEKGSDYISIVDVAGTIAYENPTAHRTLGYAAGELVGRSGFEFIHPDDLSAARRMFDGLARRAGSFAEIELRSRAKGGDWHWLHILGTNLLDDPAVGGIVLNSHDVTDQREAAEELRKVNQELDRRVGERTAAIELVYDITSMANRSQDVSQAIEFCLHRLTRYNGWRFGHALKPIEGSKGMTLTSYFYPPGADCFIPFREATENTRFSRGEGLIGRVLATRSPIWVTQVPGRLAGARSTVAGKLGLVTAVAFPVLVGEKVAAVLEFFSDVVIPVDHRITNLMSGVGMQLGRVIERANLQEHLLKIADQMQQKIAQDLHDDVGQEMTGLGLKVETLAEVLDPIDKRYSKLAADVKANVARVHGKIRTLAHRILPIEIELNSLPGALERLANESARGSQARCLFHNYHPAATFEGGVAAQLYRIAQEAVANAIRHGKPRKIDVELAVDNGHTRLSISDDGRGISSDNGAPAGLGMRIMRYRAGLIGGTLEVGPAAGKGTMVTCLVPGGEKPKSNI